MVEGAILFSLTLFTVTVIMSLVKTMRLYGD